MTPWKLVDTAEGGLMLVWRADETMNVMLGGTDEDTLSEAYDDLIARCLADNPDPEIERLRALPRRIYDWLIETNPDMDEAAFTEVHTLVTIFEAGGPEAWDAEMTRLEQEIAGGSLEEET